MEIINVISKITTKNGVDHTVFEGEAIRMKSWNFKNKLFLDSITIEKKQRRFQAQWEILQ